VTPARPPDDAPLLAWVAYLEARIANARDLTEARARDLSKQVDEVTTAVADERQAREAALTEVRQFTRDAIAGRDGSGLDLAWYGLALTLVGASLSGLLAIVQA
jgi:hypothetical protein